MWEMLEMDLEMVIRRSQIQFRPKPRELKYTWIWANRPSSKGSKLRESQDFSQIASGSGKKKKGQKNMFALQSRMISQLSVFDSFDYDSYLSTEAFFD